MSQNKKIKIGISCGDFNGVGLEILIKSFMDERARTTDTVILIILLNLIYDLDIIIEIIVFLYFLKSMIIFFGHIYFFTKKN